MHVQRLAPERVGTTANAAPAGACCCCCCCCLHTVGGIVGAVKGTALPKPDTPAVEVPVARVGGKALEPLTSASKMYWRTFWLVALVFLVGSVVEFGDEAPLVYFWLVVGGLPLGLLGTSIIAFFPLYYSARPGRRERLLHLGRITGYTFVGAVIGLMVNIVLLWLVAA